MGSPMAAERIDRVDGDALARRRLERDAAAGDLDAFARLVPEWDHDLRGVVWSVVRSSGDVDDVMQASYEKALRSLDRFESRASLKTWLHAICYRTAIDHLRRQNRQRIVPLDEALAHASPTDAAWDRIRLAEVLEGIEPENRALLMLTVGCGYSYDEVAEITNLPRGTVASRIGRTRAALRKEGLA